MVDPVNRMLYEFFNLRKTDRGWQAAQASIFDLKTNRLRPDGWTSADAAGLPILPGLARYEEVRAGEIDHALRFTVSETRRAFVYPARHFASSSEDPDLPPDPEPFPNRVIFLAAFDTGITAEEKPKYWPGDLEIVAKDLPPDSYWGVARAVPQKGGKGRWIRLKLDPPRPVGAHTKLRFRYHLTGASSMTVQMFDLTDMDTLEHLGLSVARVTQEDRTITTEPAGIRPCSFSKARTSETCSAYPGSFSTWGTIEMTTSGRTAYVGGRRNGIQLAWFPSGQLSDRREWADGRKDGVHRGWWPDGRPRYVTRFAAGLAEGVAVEWFVMLGGVPATGQHETQRVTPHQMG